MKISLPEHALVVLIGTSGAGKSTFARRHFLPTEVVSSDVCRGLVADDENCQAATADAFAVLHCIADKRLAAGRLTVVDATNVQPEARKSLVELAHAIAHSHGEEAARDDLRLVHEMPVEFQGATDDQCLRAGLLRSRHRLSTVDAVIAVQAMDAAAALVHKDPEFESIEHLEQIRLPYKPAGVGTPHRKSAGRPSTADRVNRRS